DAQVSDEIAPDSAQLQLVGARPDVRAEMAVDDAHEDVDDAWQHERPRGKEMETATPPVLVEDVVRPIRGDWSSAVLKEGRRLVESAVPIIAADGQLQQRRREIVSGVAPVQAGMRHEDHKAGEGQSEDAHGDDRVRDADPSSVALEPTRFLRFDRDVNHL